jgi:hypothetical protein
MDEKAAENRFFFLLKLQAFFFLASQRDRFQLHARACGETRWAISFTLLSVAENGEIIGTRIWRGRALE